MAESTRKVVGLKYDPGEGLPQVVLKGYGPVAEEILLRRDLISGPPVVRNDELLNKLYRLPIDAQIGPELFQVVAVILAHVFSIDGKHNQGRA